MISVESKTSSMAYNCKQSIALVYYLKDVLLPYRTRNPKNAQGVACIVILIFDAGGKLALRSGYTMRYN